MEAVGNGMVTLSPGEDRILRCYFGWNGGNGPIDPLDLLSLRIGAPERLALLDDDREIVLAFFDSMMDDALAARAIACGPCELG